MDLNNPQTFRNLAKPMGAQTDDRLTQYKKRFKDWEDPTSKTDTHTHSMTDQLTTCFSYSPRASFPDTGYTLSLSWTTKLFQWERYNKLCSPTLEFTSVDKLAPLVKMFVLKKN